MFKIGTKVRIIQPVFGCDQRLAGRTGKIIASGKWLTVKLDDPFTTSSGVPYKGTIFPQTTASTYLKAQ